MEKSEVNQSVRYDYLEDWKQRLRLAVGRVENGAHPNEIRGHMSRRARTLELDPGAWKPALDAAIPAVDESIGTRMDALRRTEKGRLILALARARTFIREHHDPEEKEVAAALADEQGPRRRR